MKRKCPCKNCITLAMCKAIMRDKFTFLPLRMRCSIFNEHYDYNEQHMSISSKEKIVLLKLFKPLDWEKRIKSSGETPI